MAMVSLAPGGGSSSRRRRSTTLSPSIGNLRMLESGRNPATTTTRRQTQAPAQTAPRLPSLPPPSALGLAPAPSFSPPSLPSTGGLAFSSLAQEALRQIRQPFSYNPQQDPRYRALTQIAQQRAQAASRRALEEMNARGLLNST